MPFWIQQPVLDFKAFKSKPLVIQRNWRNRVRGHLNKGSGWPGPHLFSLFSPCPAVWQTSSVRPREKDKLVQEGLARPNTSIHNLGCYLSAVIWISELTLVKMDWTSPKIKLRFNMCIHLILAKRPKRDQLVDCRVRYMRSSGNKKQPRTERVKAPQVWTGYPGLLL